MLTNTRMDLERLLKLLALTVTCDGAMSTGKSFDEVTATLIEFDKAWHVRALLAQSEIRHEPPTRSRRLGAGSFLYPLEDVLSKRLQQMNEAVGGDFSASLALQMNDKLFGRLFLVDRQVYSIEIGLAHMVQLFLGAITLSQPGSEASSYLPNPYQSQYGDGAAAVYASQAPLLQALEASAFKCLLPEETWRRLLAYELFSQAVEFTFLHEFGHATRGHLEFLANHGLPAERFEEGGLTGSIAPLTHQLMESQADDSAAAFVAAKWKYLSGTHRFQEGPLPMSRYGFCVTRSEDTHLVLAYAIALLFIVLDAADRGAQLVGGAGNAKTPLYPTAAYRSWRALRWQASMGVAPAPWLACIERVRNDLAADRFPHSSSIFADQLNAAELEAYDHMLMNHSKVHEEGRALMTQEATYAQMASPRRPISVPRFWGEARLSSPWTVARLVGQILRRKQ